jgi:hypothetical protein
LPILYYAPLSRYLASVMPTNSVGTVTKILHNHILALPKKSVSEAGPGPSLAKERLWL